MGVSVLFTETKDMPGSGGEEGVGGGWGTLANLCWVCALSSQNPPTPL